MTFKEASLIFMMKHHWEDSVERTTTVQVELHLKLGFTGSSDSKESTCNVRDLASIPGLRRSPAGGHSNPLQYSCLENLYALRSLQSMGSQSDTTERLSTSTLKISSLVEHEPSFLSAVLVSYCFIPVLFIWT